MTTANEEFKRQDLSISYKHVKQK